MNLKETYLWSRAPGSRGKIMPVAPRFILTSLCFFLSLACLAFGGDSSAPIALERGFRYESDGVVHLGIDANAEERPEEIRRFETVPGDAFPRDPVATRVRESFDPTSGLKVRVETTRYESYPVAESLVWFENVGGDRDVALRDVQALDVSLPTGGAPRLTYGYGEDPDPKRDYALETKTLEPGTTESFAPREGYPSYGAFPYFVVEGLKRTYILAIGWTGSWTASFTADREGNVRVVAGQKDVDVFLKPGEKLRTPRVTLFDVPTGTDVVNLWRDWFRRYIMPREDGIVLRPKLALDVYYSGELYNEVTAAEQIDAIKKARSAGLPVDALWVDAGWYLRRGEEKTSVGYWFRTGDWTPDPERFPQGFRPVVDELENVPSGEKKGKLTLWFEPERVHRSKLTDELRPFVFPNDERVESYRMNLALPQTVEFLSKRIGDAIVENGVKIYRQDSNGVGPAPFLEAFEKVAPEFRGRPGYAENLFVRGLYQFWNNLKERSPELIFDVCASGGRRNDLEMLRLGGVPLHYSDVGYFDFVAKQHMHDALNRWFIYYKNIDPHDIDPATGDFDVYRTTIDVAPFSTIRPYYFANPSEAKRRYVARFLAIRELLVDGDYYLLKGGFTESDWTVWQFDDSRGFGDDGSPLSLARDAVARCSKDATDVGSPRQTGCVLCIRNEKSEDETFRVRPRRIDVDANYRWENLETNESRIVSGAELAAGIDVKLPKRSGAAWKYSRLDPNSQK